MDEKVIDVDFRTRKEKFESFKAKILNKIDDGKRWVIRNQEALIVLTPVIIGGLTTITKVVGRQVSLHKEKQLKTLYCYDKSLGHYWRLHRDLSNQEWLQIEARKLNGEKLGNILSDMNVLK